MTAYANTQKPGQSYLFEVPLECAGTKLGELYEAVTGKYSTLVLRELDRANWKQKTTASNLGVCVRVLQRKLESENTSYQWLRDLCRFRRAVELLGAGSRSRVVREALGFNNRASLETAMHRWCGLTPNQLRAALSGNSDDNDAEGLQPVFDINPETAGDELERLLAAATGHHVSLVFIEFGNGFWSSDAVAENIGISLRALQIKLREEKYPFKSLRDLYRFHMVIKLLSAGTDVQILHEHLGFSNAVSLSRAMQRWSGMTPTQFKAAAFTGN